MKRLISLLLLALMMSVGGQAMAAVKHATAIFAGGCFWCMQSDMNKVPGVEKTVVGYTGGHTKDPTYEQVSAGGTGHLEAIEVTFDPAKLSYKELLNVYWHDIDPTDASGQFCDKGHQYTSAIFTQGREQKEIAEQSKQALIDSDKFKHVVTVIRPATKFYPAKTYHQDYYKKNPLRYRYYRYSCGRDARLKKIWG